MAAVTRSAQVSIDTVSGSKVCTISGKLAGEAIAKGDLCHIKAADNRIYKSIGTADNEAAQVHGMAFASAALGEAVTLYKGAAIWEYADSGLVAGAKLFLGLVAGQLDTVAQIGHPAPVAHAVDAQRICFVALI